MTFSLLLKADGPSNATAPVVTIALAPSTRFVGMTSAGLTCSPPAVGASGTIACTAAVATAASSTTLGVTVASATATAGAVVAIDVTVSSDTPDPTAANNHASASTAMTQATAEDADGDGLSDALESEFGLDPTRADGEDGALGDPDGDGRTNLQELADGTHPRGFHSRYFAEGSTGDFFDERLAIFNLDDRATARVLIGTSRPATRQSSRPSS